MVPGMEKSAQKMPTTIIYRDGDSERGRVTRDVFKDKETEEAEEIRAGELTSKGGTEGKRPRQTCRVDGRAEVEK